MGLLKDQGLEGGTKNEKLFWIKTGVLVKQKYDPRTPSTTGKI